MKKTMIRLALAVVLMLNIAAITMAQQPAATKDTINADKAAKPVFYQATEDEEASKGGVSSTVYIIAGIVVVAGAIFLLRKKKK